MSEQALPASPPALEGAPQDLEAPPQLRGCPYRTSTATCTSASRVSRSNIAMDLAERVSRLPARSRRRIVRRAIAPLSVGAPEPPRLARSHSFGGIKDARKSLWEGDWGWFRRL